MVNESPNYDIFVRLTWTQKNSKWHQLHLLSTKLSSLLPWHTAILNQFYHVFIRPKISSKPFLQGLLLCYNYHISHLTSPRLSKVPVGGHTCQSSNSCDYQRRNEDDWPSVPVYYQRINTRQQSQSPNKSPF